MNRRSELACRLLLGAALLLLAPASSSAASFYLCADVPTDLASTTYVPWQIVRNDGGVYGGTLTLPIGTPVGGLHRMDGGDWLLAVGASTDLGGTTFEPRDVARFDGSTFGLFFDGSAQGIPGGSSVDAVFLDGGDAGDLILSVDVPTTIGATTYDPADLIRFSAGVFSSFFDATAASPPIPTTSNVIGADVRAGLMVVTFDIPTTLGGSTFLPGELVAWDGASFASFYQDTSWPLSSRANALAFLPDPVEVPATITVAKSGGDLSIAWATGCSAGSEDFGIYEGVIGSWSSHRYIDCSDDGGDMMELIAPRPGDRYYLVVPHNPNDEGSYGTESGGGQRSVGVFQCVPTQAVASCP